ncbi:TolC family protein [Candidatus Electrothrix sp.]|uniref:TolC family protein n=1 Tax=Candidatus Electrothrix sp. TaxID=2170559 RepID=UPI004056D7B3
MNRHTATFHIALVFPVLPVLAIVLAIVLAGILSILPALCTAEEAETKKKKDTGILSSYLEQALTNNNALLAARAKLRASSHKIPQAGVLPDPKLTVQYYLEPVETRTGPQRAALALNQSLPWFGKLVLLRKLADHDQALAHAELAATELDVTRQVKEAYIAYSFLGRSQEILSNNLELLRYLEGIARDRYTGGKATYFDVLKVQIELAQIQDKVRTIKESAVPLRIRINNLLGVAPERSRPVPKYLPEISLKKKPTTLHSLALKNAPLLQAAQERITKTETKTKLAQKDFYPDFTFSLKTILTGSAEYGDPPDSGDDPIIAGVSMNLPIFRERRHAKLAEQKAAVQEAQSRKSEQERTIQNQIEQGLYAYQDAKRKVALYREELLPKVRQQLEVAVSGFQSGKNSILEIIDAEKSLLTFELAESRTLADQALAVAQLEAQVGLVVANWQEQP